MSAELISVGSAMFSLGILHALDPAHGKVFLGGYLGKVLKKGILKPKIEKSALLYLFNCLCLDICEKKIANFSPTSLWRSYSFQV